MASTQPNVGGREIFIAVVAPVGGPVDSTLKALKRSLESHGYSVEGVRISQLIDTAVPTPEGDIGLTRLRKLMNKGDAFRKRLEDQAACGYLAVQAISRARELATGDRRKHRIRHVNVIRSLKTADEVRLLRQVYGDRLIVVGVGASREERRAQLTKDLKAEGAKGVDEEVARLLERDAQDDAERYGQRASEAYRLSDAFVSAKTQAETSVVTRLVELLLGEPFRTPTRDEQGMFHAWAAKFRSSAAGRQVGAAIVDRDGEIVAVGCNDVPKPGGGQFWEGDVGDRRDFQLGYDANDRGKFGVARDALNHLADSGWLVDEYRGLSPHLRAARALEENGPLVKTELEALIEYGRNVHAEMAALMTAARTGRSVRGCELFTTTYPCHECARLIIAAGVTRICFIDPYLKSRSAELYAGLLHGTSSREPVVVERFQGVSPRLFPRAFEMTNRAKDVEGNYEGWTDKSLVMGNEEFVDTIPAQEDAVAVYLAARLEETGGALK